MIVPVLRSLCICLVLCGCVGFRAVEGGMPVNVGNDVTVDPQVAWANPFGAGISGAVWTIDGFGLNELRFLTGIKPGDPLIQISGVARAEIGVYQTSMLPNDVMDLLTSTLGRAGLQQIRTDRLRPTSFGGAGGFRFDLEYLTKSGLQMKGMVLAAQRAGKLDLIMFTAPAEYYFDHHAPTVEQIFASIQVPNASAQARRN